jgi:hypothetical protein
MCADAGVHKGIQLFSGSRSFKTEVVRPRTFAECSKVHCIHLHAPSYSSHTTPSTARDKATISKMGHTIVVGLPKLRVLRQNPPVGSALPRANRVRDKVT